MARPTGYGIARYGDMIASRARMEPYVRALRAAVRPGSTVLDLGAGTGIFSLLACRFGAGQVHAVEPHDVISVAREAALANGFGDRITFHQCLSTEVVLPQPAEVIVSDLRGVLPQMERHIAAISDARRRLLAPAGTLIPRRDSMWLGLVEDADLGRRYAEPWVRNPYDLDLSAGRALVVNTVRQVHAKAASLLAPPQCWATLDYETIENPSIAGEASLMVERPGTCHGIGVWFDSELSEDCGFSNAPGAPELIYGQAFMPLQEPVRLAAGDQVVVRLAADFVGDEYVWTWDMDAFSPGPDRVQLASFRQSTFFGSPIDPRRLHARSPHRVPVLSQAGEVDKHIFSLIDGRATLEEIARRVVAHFPERFVHWEDALPQVAKIADRVGDGG